jgi:hypothetical protein
MIDYKNTRETLRKHAIDALRAQGMHVDVYISSYMSPVYEEVACYFGARTASFADGRSPESSQSRCMRDGLEMIPDAAKYDAILVLRFDLELLRPLTYLLDTTVSDSAKTDVTLLWREKSDGQPVADCIHVIRGTACASFIAALDKCPTTRDMHWILPHLAAHNLTVRFAHKDRCYDSNSDNEPNPTYRIVRMHVLQPTVARQHN